MSRRGLVSKSFGPSGGAPGGPALMPKGEKPSSSNILPIEDVAATLRVQPSQVLEWVQKDKLRGNDSGIKPYDLKKFQHDHQEEIRQAQARALKNEQKPVDKKPAKGGGLLGWFFRGKERDSVGAQPSNLAQENKRLRAELSQARSESSGSSATNQLEDKVRYLEGKLAKTSSLEAEVTDLRRQLAAAERSSPTADPQLEKELEKTRRELAHSQELAQQASALRSALEAAEEERERLNAELAQQSFGQEDNSAALEEQLEATRTELQQLQDRLESIRHEEESHRSALQTTLSQREELIEGLRRELDDVRAHAPSQAPPQAIASSEPLIEELLVLQETNLARFARLQGLYQAAQDKLSQLSSLPDSPLAEENYARLQADFETLRVKHQSLLEAREANLPDSQEFAEQLAAARANNSRLKQENSALKSRLSENDIEPWKAKVEELQQRLAQGHRTNDAGLELAETELRAVRKTLQNREAQVQKIAGRLQENERALKKALKESTRLTELLIERENRLRDLSTEYEQEYRDKVDNLDKQVSGLQWKLSLREERIASLEREVSELRKSKS